MDLEFQIKLLKLIVAMSENTHLENIIGEKFSIHNFQLSVGVGIKHKGNLSGIPVLDNNQPDEGNEYNCIGYKFRVVGNYNLGLFLHSEIWKEHPILLLDDIKGIISDYHIGKLDKTSMRLAFGNLLSLKDPQPIGYLYPLMESLTDAIDAYEAKYGKL